MISKSISQISTSVSSGSTPLRSNPDYWKDGKIPWLKTEQLGKKHIYDTNEKTTKRALEETSLQVYSENTLSVAMYGEGKTRGNVSIIKTPMTTNQACCNIVINNDEADFEFIYYYLKNQYENLRKLSSGVRKNLNANDIKNFTINLPKEVKAQKKQVEALVALDEKIELNQNVNTQLEKLIVSIFEYWFLQFDFPDENGRPYKSSDGRMVHSELTKTAIPFGWEEAKLSDIVDCVIEKTIAGENKFLPYVPIDDLPRKQLVSGNSSPNENALSSLILFQKHDILFGAMRPYFHRVCLGIEKGITRSTVMVLRPNSDALRYFTLMQINTETSVKFATQNSTGSTIPYTFWENGFANYPIIVPPENLLEKFNLIAHDIFERLISNEKDIRNLSSTLDWLLPKIMNGQVTVGD